MLNIDGLEIEISNGSHDFPVIQGVSLQILKGETLALVGESGSGKSLLAHSIAGLLPKAAKLKSGSIILDSRDLLQLTDREMNQVRGRDIALIFQNPMTSLNPLKKIGFQIIKPIVHHQKIGRKVAKARAIEMLSDLGVKEAEKVYSKYPHQLSGGQIQRVMIACTLSCNPKLLIADEATTALDTVVQRQVLDLLMSVQEKYGMALLFITHDLGVVAKIADRVAVIRNGAIEELADSHSLFHSPKSSYTKALIACRPPLTFKPSRLAVLNDFYEKSKIPVSQEKKIEEQADIFLELKNLSKTYRKDKFDFLNSHEVVALENINLKLKAGVNLGIVGASGSGKSSLAQVMAKLIEIDSGQIVFQGRDLSQLRHEQLKDFRRRVQYLFQDSFAALNPTLTVLDLMLEPMEIQDYGGSEQERIDKVHDLLTRVGLPLSCLEKRPSQLSGGQRQRICIARSLTLDPELLICDESVAALDVSNQAVVLNMLLQLQEELGFSYIFVSHDLALVHFFCDELLVLDQGKIVESGAVDLIFQHGTSPVTKALIEAIPSTYDGSMEVFREVYELPSCL